MNTHDSFNKVIALTGALMLATLGAVTGHYNPGQTADFAEAFPGYPSFVYENMFTYYNGSAGGWSTVPYHRPASVEFGSYLVQ